MLAIGDSIFHIIEGLDVEISDNKLVVFLTTLHCIFMLHTQRGCLNSRLCEGTIRDLQETESGVKMPIGHIDMK